MLVNKNFEPVKWKHPMDLSNDQFRCAVTLQLADLNEQAIMDTLDRSRWYFWVIKR